MSDTRSLVKKGALLSVCATAALAVAGIIKDVVVQNYLTKDVTDSIWTRTKESLLSSSIPNWLVALVACGALAVALFVWWKGTKRPASRDLELQKSVDTLKSELEERGRLLAAKASKYEELEQAMEVAEQSHVATQERMAGELIALEQAHAHLIEKLRVATEELKACEKLLDDEKSANNQLAIASVEASNASVLEIKRLKGALAALQSGRSNEQEHALSTAAQLKSDNASLQQQLAVTKGKLKYANKEIEKLKADAGKKEETSEAKPDIDGARRLPGTGYKLSQLELEVLNALHEQAIRDSPAGLTVVCKLVDASQASTLISISSLIDKGLVTTRMLGDGSVTYVPTRAARALKI